MTIQNLIQNILTLSIIVLFRINKVKSIECVGMEPEDFYYCTTLDEYILPADEECVLATQQCDGTRDCIFGDDEWNCNTFNSASLDCTLDNGFFECSNSTSSDFLATSNSDPVCIRSEWSCQEIDPTTNEPEAVLDCPNAEDITPTFCPTELPTPCTDPTDPLFDIYFECSESPNGICIYIWWVCNGFEDCENGEDELLENCPTAAPTSAPSNAPSDTPVIPPTNAPSDAPSDTPTATPAEIPSDAPTDAPSDAPSSSPAQLPFDAPTGAPSDAPSDSPGEIPSDAPSDAPSEAPSSSPGEIPTDAPSDAPSESPGEIPTDAPSDSPGELPTDAPSDAPSGLPSRVPTAAPGTVPSAPTRPSCWWTNYRGGNGARDEDGNLCIPTDSPTPAPSELPNIWWTNYRGNSDRSGSGTSTVGREGTGSATGTSTGAEGSDTTDTVDTTDAPDTTATIETTENSGIDTTSISTTEEEEEEEGTSTDRGVDRGRPRARRL